MLDRWYILNYKNLFFISLIIVDFIDKTTINSHMVVNTCIICILALNIKDAKSKRNYKVSLIALLISLAISTLSLFIYHYNYLGNDYIITQKAIINLSISFSLLNLYNIIIYKYHSDQIIKQQL